MMNFKGRVALVTGAADGIGKGVAIMLAEYGASLILLDRDMEKLNTVKEKATAFGVDILAYECDISDEERVYKVVDEAREHMGKIDILVNNAAIWRCHSLFMDTPTDEWRRYFDINVLGTVYVTRAALPSMLENGYGRIINVASVAGVYGNAKMVHYSATKGAVISMTKGLAKEVADKGITVNAVSPGSVSRSEKTKELDEVQPSELSFMGRTGSFRENASLICYLASEEASYISGQNIQIDGCRKKQ